MLITTIITVLNLLTKLLQLGQEGVRTFAISIDFFEILLTFHVSQSTQAGRRAHGHLLIMVLAF